jgi:hypothetical protein
MTLAELDQKYGSVTHEGQTYTLTDVATHSNRPFPGWWGDASENEPSYTDEWVCAAIDADGNEYDVYWQFDAIKGEEPEDAGNLPWDDENISRVVSR